jgi:hypothetical protein
VTTTSKATKIMTHARTRKKKSVVTVAPQRSALKGKIKAKQSQQSTRRMTAVVRRKTTSK